ncbi:MAG: hypothetical protein ABFR36_03600 [Acidobacteriota bacterium]
MKIKFIGFILGFCLFLSFLSLRLLPQTGSTGDEDKVVETVDVTDFEIPVRVFHKKNLVDNLKKEDFLLYEGGKLQKINGFYMTRKKIQIEESIKDDLNQPEGKGRYFVLVFKITEFNDQLKKGMDFLFDKLFRKSDELLIFINDKTFFIKNLSNQVAARELVSRILRSESIKAKQRLSRVLDKIDTELSYSRFNQILGGAMAQPALEMIKFLENYLIIWNNYRLKYLTPSVDDYYNFARYLQKIEKEKWVINFYQIEMFPKLKRTGEMMQSIKSMISQLQGSNRGEDVFHSRALSGLLMKINIALNATTDFPAEEISKLFYKVNTVFHSIFINTTKTILSQDLEYKRISSNLENSFREITERTGGSLISSGNISKSVKKLTEKEDILYMLTYTPDEGKKAGKIRVTTKNSAYKVIYDNNMRDKYIERYFRNKESNIPAVSVEEAKLDGKTLFIKIKDYFWRKENGRRLGKLNIHIQVVSSSGRVYFNQTRTIVADKKSFSVSLNLRNLEKGEYSIVVDVLDLLTEKTDMKYFQSKYK